jgi:DNA-binding transcriptional LysR family regulator
VGAAQLAFFKIEAANGHLISPFEQIMERDLQYWCIWPKFRRRTPALRMLTDWLRSQAETRSPTLSQEMRSGT